MQFTSEQEKAIAAYKTASPKNKALLETIFGSELFIPNPVGTIALFSEVCEAMGKNESDYVITDDMPLKQQLDIQGEKLDLIARFFNQGKKPDLADTNQRKYRPWFNIIPDKTKRSGFGLSFNDYVYSLTCTALGVRLAFLDQEACVYAAKTFLPDYELYMQIQNDIFNQ